MSPSKKSKGIGAMIALGKSGSAPPPRYKEPEATKQKSVPAPEIPSAAPPKEEAAEGYAEQLLSDMMAPLTQAGLEEADAKEMLAQIFDAAAACLRGAGEPEATPVSTSEDAGGGYGS